MIDGLPPEQIVIERLAGKQEVAAARVVRFTEQEAITQNYEETNVIVTGSEDSAKELAYSRITYDLSDPRWENVGRIAIVRIEDNKWKVWVQINRAMS